MPFDLIKAVKYENDIVEFDKLSKNSKLKKEFTPKSEKIQEVIKEIKVYTEEDHFNKTSEKIKELYQKLKEEILNLGDIDVEYKKFYIVFKGNTNIVDAEIYNSKIKLFINMKIGTLNHPINIARDMSKVGHHGNGDYAVDINSEDDIEKVISLIKQSLKINKR